MTHRVGFTRSAVLDLETIRDYLEANASPRVAARLMGLVLDPVASLQEHPLRGAHVPELRALGDHSVRQLHVRPYRIVYGIEPGGVFVYLVCDQRRDYSTLLAHRLLGMEAKRTRGA